MKRSSLIAFLFVLTTTCSVIPVLAGNNDPLFVNMTTDQDHRSTMALGFSKAQFERGHPVTIFLNDKGVLVASKNNADQFKEQQAILLTIIKKGGLVIACPSCMKKYGVTSSDLLGGIKVGTPELTGEALFQDNTKTLSW
jgi:sulfur relay (sulfurtransferase) complex TusBCD TusD component (DsrE family)